MNSIRRLAITSVLVALVLMPLSGAMAQDDQAYITYRQKVMGSLAANLGAIAEVVKQKLPYGSNLAGHAANINTNSKQIATAFKKEVTEGKTDALPKIWSDWNGFNEKIDALEKESAKLMQVASSGDMGATGAQLKATLKTCGGCHKNFRKDKKQSYKMKKM